MPRRSTPPAQAPDDPVVQPQELVTQVRSLLAEAQALSSRLASLNEIAIRIQEHLNTDQLLQTLARHARWVIDFQICSIAWIVPQGYRVQILRDAHLEPGPIKSLAEGAIGRALDGQHALLINQYAEADDLPQGVQSALIIPLKSGGRTLGTLNFCSSNPDQYSLDDLRIASALTTQAAAVLQNVQLFTEIAQARDELHTVLESIGDAVLVIDRGGMVRMTNGAAARLLGLDLAALNGRPLLDLLSAATRHGSPLADPTALDQLHSAWERINHSGSGTLQLTDGRHLEWALAPLTSVGVLDGAVITLRDVSDRIALEQLRDDMIQMLVHDLRTPLTGMIMGLDMLDFALKRGDTALGEETMNMARMASHRLLDQINMLLDLRKIEAGRFILDRAPALLHELVNFGANTVRTIAQNNNQTIVTAYADDILFVELDQGLIRRVIENLLGNAVKFAPVNSTITLGTRIVDETAEVSVTDQGAGIPAEMRTLIFEKYGQVQGNLRHRGTGLGLTFCKLVVEQHGGTIGVDMPPEGGSRFWFRLPLNPS